MILFETPNSHCEASHDYALLSSLPCGTHIKCRQQKRLNFDLLVVEHQDTLTQIQNQVVHLREVKDV